MNEAVLLGFVKTKGKSVERIFRLWGGAQWVVMIECMAHSELIPLFAAYTLLSQRKLLLIRKQAGMLEEEWQ